MVKLPIVRRLYDATHGIKRTFSDNMELHKS